MCTSNTNSYLDDEEATQAAYTSDGFFKTGDCARLINGDYVIDGRASTDCKYMDHIDRKVLVNFV